METKIIELICPKEIRSYKKNIHVIAQIHENYWNNNMILQLDIKDIFI